MRRERGTFQATVLVHDLYLQMLEQEPGHFPNRRAFFGFAAAAMRHILVDHVRARRRKARIRCERVRLSDDLAFIDPTAQTSST